MRPLSKITPGVLAPSHEVLTPGEWRALGSGQRRVMPRSSHARWVPPADRPDPVTVLEEQAKTRVPDLVPIRYGRMAVSPFAYFRGAAAPMAWDLAHTPTTDIRVQACGDAHLLNFGMYAAPDRRLVFDVNDFDETLPAPFDWDVKRLAASVAVAAREHGFSDRAVHTAARADRAQLSHKGGRICRDALPRCLVLQDRHRRGGPGVRRAAAQGGRAPAPPGYSKGATPHKPASVHENVRPGRRAVPHPPGLPSDRAVPRRALSERPGRAAQGRHTLPANAGGGPAGGAAALLLRRLRAQGCRRWVGRN